MGTELPIICLVDDINSGIVQILSSYPRCLIIQNTPNDIRRGLTNINFYLGKRYEVEPNFSPKAVASEVLKMMI